MAAVLGAVFFVGLFVVWGVLPSIIRKRHAAKVENRLSATGEE